MYILGINGSSNPVHNNYYDVSEGAHHDAAAALLKGGQIISAFEEERLNRIKHTNKWPKLAIDACLSSNNLSVDQIDYFTFNLSNRLLDGILARYYERQGLPSPGAVAFLQGRLEEQFQTTVGEDKIELFEHHYVHAVTAFYPSGFNEALVLTIDGSGGEYSGSVYDGNNKELSVLKTFLEDQSLGHFYSNVTFMLGFGLFDEYKVMGLAPYGTPKTYRKLFRDFYSLLPDGNYRLYTERAKVITDVCPARSRNAGFNREQMDIAASLQEMLEKIVFHVVRHWKQATGHTRLCIAGGVGLNCTLNGKLINSGLFEDVFVFPGAGDSGLPIGSALACYFKHSKDPESVQLKNLYFGSGLGGKDTIIKELDQWKQLICYEQVENAPLRAAELLADDKVIGWVQGRSEFAPRALGNRSILADARPAKNKERINSIVKKREGFRPFASSVLMEYAAEYFELPENCHIFPYMMFVLNVRKRYRQHLGAVTHVDGTARVQTVLREDNREYWELINHFMKITGTPVILNTSFNNNAEPIVDSVKDAVVCFLTTNLDYLLVEDYLISKKTFQPEELETLYPAFAPHIILRRQENYSWFPAPGNTSVFELANTYNGSTLPVSCKMFELLREVNATSPLWSLLDNLGINDTEERRKMVKDISALWDKRILTLNPCSPVEQYGLKPLKY